MGEDKKKESNNLFYVICKDEVLKDRLRNLRKFIEGVEGEKFAEILYREYTQKYVNLGYRKQLQKLKIVD